MSVKFEDLKIGEYYILQDSFEDAKWVATVTGAGSSPNDDKYLIFNDVIAFWGPDIDTGYRYSEGFFNSSIDATRIDIKDYPEYLL